MKASILDLRYKMKDVLHALDRNEEIKILYHGKLKGTISPPIKQAKSNITEHPFFGMSQKEKKTVKKKMQEIRGNRYNAF